MTPVLRTVREGPRAAPTISPRCGAGVRHLLLMEKGAYAAGFATV
jgi:hypothetical protein